MITQTWVVGPFQSNCSLLACPRTGEAVLVDPGDEPERILKVLESTRLPDGSALRLKYLFHTHGHLDHIGASRPIREALERKGQVPLIALHRGDEELYQKLKAQGAVFGLNHYQDPLPIDHYFEDEEELRVGELRFSVLHTPGHSPGGVCLRLHEDKTLAVAETLFSGDTLFQGSVGRTDLWGGDPGVLLKSIRTRILSLDDEIRVCPGHGPDTRIGIEKRENPFL